MHYKTLAVGIVTSLYTMYCITPHVNNPQYYLSVLSISAHKMAIAYSCAEFENWDAFIINEFPVIAAEYNARNNRFWVALMVSSLRFLKWRESPIGIRLLAATAYGFYFAHTIDTLVVKFTANKD